jgi:hypothetical protein
VKVTIRTLYWGDHRGVPQLAAYDAILRKRWRLLVARNIKERARLERYRTHQEYGTISSGSAVVIALHTKEREPS